MLNPGWQDMSLSSFTRRVLLRTALGACAVALSGCQGMILTTPARPQVRIIDVSPDSPDLDLYQNKSAIAYRLGFGTITSYVPVDPGTATTVATLSGTRQKFTSSRTMLAKAGQYTVLIGNYSSSLQQVVLKDQSQPAPPGQVALRFINQATRNSPVDIYLVSAGQALAAVTPVVSGAGFGANTGYMNLPAGVYTLMLMPAGVAPSDGSAALYTGARVIYGSGAADTIVLIDEQRPEAQPGMQAIIAPDYTPVTEE